MKQPEITDDVHKKMEEYRFKVFNYFDAMIDEEKTDETTDPFDPSIPAVSEDFLLNHDRTSHYFNDETLEVNSFCNMYLMVRPGKSVIQALNEWVKQQVPGYCLSHISGFFFYPNNQGFMGWHTNADQVGYRIYLSYAFEDNKSFFRYWDYDKEEIITTWDKAGWNARLFYTSDDPERLYWHCVYSETDRLSIGMEIKEV